MELNNNSAEQEFRVHSESQSQPNRPPSFYGFAAKHFPSRPQGTLRMQAAGVQTPPGPAPVLSWQKYNGD